MQALPPKNIKDDFPFNYPGTSNIILLVFTGPTEPFTTYFFIISINGFNIKTRIESPATTPEGMLPL